MTPPVRGADLSREHIEKCVFVESPPRCMMHESAERGVRAPDIQLFAKLMFNA